MEAEIKPEPLLRLSQCFLCHSWEIDSKLILIEVPDQAGWVKRVWSAYRRSRGVIDGSTNKDQGRLCRPTD